VFPGDSTNIVWLLNISQLPALRGLFLDIYLGCVLGPVNHVSTVFDIVSNAKPNLADEATYGDRLSQRMLVLELVRLVFVVEDVLESQERGRGWVMATSFTKKCWRSGMLRAFVEHHPKGAAWHLKPCGVGKGVCMYEILR
jgi:hypothetical protein